MNFLNLRVIAMMIASACLLANTSCAGEKKATKKTVARMGQIHKPSFHKDRLTHFTDVYEGVFSTQKSERTLYVVSTRIWKHTGQIWFYNAVFMDDLPEEPLQQEVALLQQLTADSLMLQFYKIAPEVAKDYSVAWRQPENLESLSKKHISLVESCNMYITRKDTVFELREHGLCPLYSSEDSGFGFTFTSIDFYEHGFRMGTTCYDKRKNVVREPREGGDLYTRLVSEESMKSILDRIDALIVQKK